MLKPQIEINIAIYATTAESGPPLGTVLGNLGVNTVKFCKEFNDYTEDLPNYIKLRTKILVSENKNFSFSCKAPSIGYLISLLKFDHTIYDEENDD